MQDGKTSVEKAVELSGIAGGLPVPEFFGPFSPSHTRMFDYKAKVQSYPMSTM